MYTFINLFDIKIPSYGLCMTIAFLTCSFLIISKAKKQGLITEDVIVFIAVTLGCALVGGGGLYIAVSYSIEEISEYIKNLDFSFLISGGIVFYGGLLGGIFGGICTIKLLNISVSQLEKCVVPYIPLGHAIGRIGCLMAGCCYGIEYKGAFAVSSEFLPSSYSVFPVQALEALLNVMTIPILTYYSRKSNKKYRLLSLYLILYSLIRIFTECFRGDGIRGGMAGISTSQWISLAILPISLISFILLRNSSDKKAL